MRTFDAPIPGQSLTDTPKNAPYERPPEIVDPMEAIDAHIDNLNKDGAMEDVLYFLEMGVDLQTMVQGILRSGVVAGIHSIDVSLIIAPIIHEYIKGFAEAVDLEFDEGFENKEAKEVITYQRDVARAKKMLAKIKEERGMAPMPEPEMEMEPEMEPEKPEMVEEEPVKTGLMARV
tara:strand:+ start:405 stop:932 length:528 start_codon:yes stop_codon:yes gene_type:complete